MNEDEAAVQEIQMNAEANEIANMVLLKGDLEQELLKAAVMIDSYGSTSSSKKSVVLLDCPVSSELKKGNESMCRLI